MLSVSIQDTFFLLLLLFPYSSVTVLVRPSQGSKLLIEIRSWFWVDFCSDASFGVPIWSYSDSASAWFAAQMSRWWAAPCWTVDQTSGDLAGDWSRQRCFESENATDPSLSEHRDANAVANWKMLEMIDTVKPSISPGHRSKFFFLQSHRKQRQNEFYLMLTPTEPFALIQPHNEAFLLYICVLCA